MSFRKLRQWLSCGWSKPWSNIWFGCKMYTKKKGKKKTIFGILTWNTERQSFHFLILFLSPKQTKIHIPEAAVFELCFCLYLSETEKTQSKKRQKRKNKHEQGLLRKVAQLTLRTYSAFWGIPQDIYRLSKNPARPINQIKLVLLTFFPADGRAPVCISIILYVLFSDFISTSHLLSQIYGLSWSSWSVLRRPEPRPCNWDKQIISAM